MRAAAGTNVSGPALATTGCTCRATTTSSRVQDPRPLGGILKALDAEGPGELGDRGRMTRDRRHLWSSMAATYSWSRAGLPVSRSRASDGGSTPPGRERHRLRASRPRDGWTRMPSHQSSEDVRREFEPSAPHHGRASNWFEQDLHDRLVELGLVRVGSRRYHATAYRTGARLPAGPCGGRYARTARVGSNRRWRDSAHNTGRARVLKSSSVLQCERDCHRILTRTHVTAAYAGGPGHPGPTEGPRYPYRAWDYIKRRGTDASDIAAHSPGNGHHRTAEWRRSMRSSTSHGPKHLRMSFRRPRRP